MNFALLNKAKKKRSQVNEEFDIVKYLKKTNKLQDYMDIYMLNEPIPLLDSTIEFDRVNSLSANDPEISLKKMFGG
jgi:hypothetical protein